MKQKPLRFINYSLCMLFSLVLAVSVPVQTLAGGEIIPPSEPVKLSGWDVLGPNGGDARVVAIDPKNKEQIYVSTQDGQIHKSTDGGKSWQLLVNFNRPLLILDQLFVDPRDSNVIYVSGHRGEGAGGFFKSTDGGASWKEAKELKGEAVHAMTQSTADLNVITVGTTKGVFISRDSGDSWTKVESDSSPLNVNSMAIDPRNPKTMYAGTWWRPYKTTDGGKSWRLIKNGLIDDSDVFAITINSKDPEHVIASACSGIYESFNGGEKWAKIQGIPSQSRRTRDILQHPTKQGTVYAGTTEGLWMTADGGKRWSLTTQKDLEVNSIAVHPDSPDRVFIATNNYGVMVSDDGGRNFKQTNDSFTSRFTYSISADVQQPNRLYATTINTATGGGFVFTSNDGGTTWQQPKNYDVLRVAPFALVQDRVTPDTIYLATNVGIFKSIDRGASFTHLTPPKPKPAPKKRVAAKKKPAAKVAAKPAPEATPAPPPAFVPALTEKVKVLAFTEDGKNGLLAGTDRGLYRSYDTAKGWDRVQFGEGLNDNIQTVYTTPQQPETIWVGTATSGVIVSRDGGQTWARVDGISPEYPISSIASDPKRPDYLYVGTTQTLYLSRDGGKSWTRRGGNLPIGNFTSILINPNDTNEIFIASALHTDGGIFYSKDAGMNWRRVDSKEMKLPSRRVWSMIFDPNNPGRIFAATHSSGIYRIERAPDTASTDAVTRPRISSSGN